MNNKPDTIKKNDVFIKVYGEKVTLEHEKNLFAPILRVQTDFLNTLIMVHRIPESDISVMLDTIYVVYFVIKDRMVLDKPLNSFAEAVEKANYWNSHYQEWLDMQSEKGFSKKKFIEDVKTGSLSARMIATSLRGRNLDEKYFPLVKTKGFGSIDIVRDGKSSVLFYLDEQKSSLMVYSGDKLKIFSPGYRLYNKKEMACITDWQKERNHKAELADLMSDGTKQFNRKCNFYKDRGCHHLIGQRFNLLVQTHEIRQCVELEYDIKKQ